MSARVRFRPEMALAHLQLAGLLLDEARASSAGRSRSRREAGGLPAEAATYLDTAIDEFASRGMQPALERALALRDRLEPKPDAAAANPHRLTDRELEVLRLIAAGRTGREIAAQLVLAVDTVRRHTTNVYAKIGAHGRAAATAYALRHHLIPPP